MHVCKCPLETRAYVRCSGFRDSAGILMIRIKNPFYRVLLNKKNSSILRVDLLLFWFT